MKVVYDSKGLGIAELMGLALYHPLMHTIVVFLISHNAQRTALKIARMIV